MTVPPSKVGLLPTGAVGPLRGEVLMPQARRRPRHAVPREASIVVRLSSEERDRLRHAAGLQGLALGRFIAEAALDRADGIRRRYARLAVPPRELLAVQIELREVARQVRAVGVNVNQVAAVANSEGVPPENAAAVLAFCGRVLSSSSAVLDRVDRLSAALDEEAGA